MNNGNAEQREKFPPAPWMVEFDGRIFIIYDRARNKIAEVRGVCSHKQNRATAVLIAATPVMFDALQKIAEKEPAEYYECGGACDNCYDMIDLAREVMGVIEEKARGGK